MSLPQRGFPLEAIGSRVENKYLCSHCQRILRNPVQSYCGHRYCKSCIEQLLRGSETVMCQSCKQEHNEDEEIVLEQVFPDNATKRELYALPASCPNEGCKWAGTLKGFVTHEKECPLRREECQCGGRFRPEDLEAHLTNECPYRLVTCPHCNTKVQFRQVETHLAECPKVPVRCRRCGEDGIIREQLPVHMNTPTCRPRILCPYGCGLMVEEAQIDDHLRQAVRPHMDALGQSLSTLTTRVDQGLTEMSGAVKELSRAEGGAVGGAAGGVEAMETGEGTDINRQLSTLEQKVNLFEQVSVVLQREIVKATRAAENAVSQSRTDRDRIETLERQVQSLLAGAPPAPGPTPAVGPTPNASTTPASTDGTLVWRITNYSQKKQDSISGIRQSFNSQPFYTGPTGYKLCARVYPNGDGVGKGSHFSVFLVILRGPYDPLLKWPFRQKVIMSLLDQGPRKNHIVDSFRPDPGSNSFQRPVSEFNTASGCPMFAKLETISQVSEFQYIKDDVMFLRVSIDTAGL